VYTSTITTR